MEIEPIDSIINRCGAEVAFRTLQERSPIFKDLTDSAAAQAIKDTVSCEAFIRTFEMLEASTKPIEPLAFALAAIAKNIELRIQPIEQVQGMGFDKRAYLLMKEPCRDRPTRKVEPYKY